MYVKQYSEKEEQRWGCVALLKTAVIKQVGVDANRLLFCAAESATLRGQLAKVRT